MRATVLLMSRAGTVMEFHRHGAGSSCRTDQQVSIGGTASFDFSKLRIQTCGCDLNARPRKWELLLCWEIHLHLYCSIDSCEDIVSFIASLTTTYSLGYMGKEAEYYTQFFNTLQDDC